MHETRIAYDLTQIIVDVSCREHLNRITKVNLQFGQMIQIVPDIFYFAFMETAKGTIVEGAEVNLEILPVKLLCNNCSKEIDVENVKFRCIFCDSTDIEIIQGKEMIIKSVEGE